MRGQSSARRRSTGARPQRPRAAGGLLAQRAEADQRAGPRWSSRCWPSSARGTSTPWRRHAELRGRRRPSRSAGWWATPCPVAERLARPVDVDPAPTAWSSSPT